MTCMTRVQTTEAPRWATVYDRVSDATDAYHEISDPTGEHGETCTAFFDYEPQEVEPSNPFEKCWFEDFPKLTGICINDRHGPSYVDRENAIQMLGLETVERIEGAA